MGTKVRATASRIFRVSGVEAEFVTVRLKAGHRKLKA